MLKKGLLFPTVVLAAIGVVITAAVVVPKIKNQNQLPTPESDSIKTDSTSAPLAPALDQAADWPTYENIGFRLRFQYPPEIEIEELYDLAPHFLQLNLLGEGQKAQAIFMIKIISEPEEAYDFVGSQPQDVKNIADQTWYFFDFPRGFSNSPPFTAYQDRKNGILYTFKFYDVVSDWQRDLIMATIEIISSP